MSSVRRAASLDEVPAGQPKVVEVDGVRVVLARVGDAVYACGDVCTHRGGPLGEGKLNGARLACPWHGWMFDVRTGQHCAGSRVVQPRFDVRVEGDWILVDLG